MSRNWMTRIPKKNVLLTHMRLLKLYQKELIPLIKKTWHSCHKMRLWLQKWKWSETSWKTYRTEKIHTKTRKNAHNDQKHQSQSTQTLRKKRTHELLMGARKHTTHGKILITRSGRPHGWVYLLQPCGREHQGCLHILQHMIPRAQR